MVEVWELVKIKKRGEKEDWTFVFENDNADEFEIEYSIVNVFSEMKSLKTGDEIEIEYSTDINGDEEFISEILGFGIKSIDCLY